MKHDYYLAMPTRGRLDKQSTLKNLHKEIAKLVNVYCHPGELKEFSLKYGSIVNSVKEYGGDCSHIGEIRDFIIKDSESRNVIFMDDNLRFQSRIKNERVLDLKGSIFEIVPKNYSDEEILSMQLEMFNWVFEKLDEYAMAGFSFRPFNRMIEEDEKENCKLFAFWGINVEKYNNQNIRLSDWELKEDFALNINFIMNGENTVCNYKYSFDKAGGANQKGGCSEYRTLLKQNEYSIRLKDVFGDFIKIREKVNKNRWGGVFENSKRLEVIIYWNKLVKHGQKVNKISHK